jgi:hypothetical protein
METNFIESDIKQLSDNTMSRVSFTEVKI